MIRAALALSAFLSVALAHAQTDNPLRPLDNSSPRATLASFWEQARAIEDAYVAYRADKSFAKMEQIFTPLERMRQLFDLSEVPAALRNKVGGESALYLFDILLRLPSINLDTVPGGPGFDAETGLERWSIPDTMIQIVRMEEGPRSGDYLFSSDVVEDLPQWHALMGDRPALQPTAYENWRTEQIRFTGPWFAYSWLESIPEGLRVIVLGTPLWKVVFVVVIGVTALLLIGLWGRLVHRLTRDGSAVWQLALRLTIPGLLALLAWQLGRLQLLQLNLSGAFGEGYAVTLTLALIAAGAWAAWLAAYFVVEVIISSPTIPDQSYDAHLLRLLARVAAVVGAAAVLVYGANQVGVPALGLVAGLGVGGFALALAAQSTVENLFGGMNLFADRPFRVGDFIRYGSGLGTVERIGPRSSRIRGLDSTLTTVPNSDLARMHITNFSFRRKILFHHVLGLRYETSPEQFVWLAEALKDRLGAHSMVESTDDYPRVRVLGFGASSIDVDIRAYVLTTDYGEFLAVQEELVLDIIRIVGEAGTGFAFPSQTAYLARDTGLDEAARERTEALVRAQTQRPDAAPEAEARHGAEAAVGREAASVFRQRPSGDSR